MEHWQFQLLNPHFLLSTETKCTEMLNLKLRKSHSSPDVTGPEESEAEISVY